MIAMTRSPHPAAAEALTVDRAASTVGFRVRHLGVSTVRGEFTEFSADVRRDGDRLRIHGLIDPSTVLSGNAIRDRRLRDEFFVVAEHPAITFSGTLRDGCDVAEGELTIRGVTRPVRLAVRREALPDGAVRLIADGTISRIEFDLDWAALREAGKLLVADRVRLHADVVLRPAG